MSPSWWMWLVGVALLVAVVSGLHWTVLDFLLDRFSTRRGKPWGDREAESSGTAMPDG